MARMKLSAPWVLFYHEVEAMFKEDPEVHVIYDDIDKPTLKLFVKDPDKAEAISYLMPPFKEYGDVTLEILVIPSNSSVNKERLKSMNPDFPDICGLFEVAFALNPAFCYVEKVSGIMSNPIYYVVFSKKVVQYFTDDLGDAHGVRSTLYQEMAKDIFIEIDGVHYCTDISDTIPHSSRYPWYGSEPQ